MAAQPDVVKERVAKVDLSSAVRAAQEAGGWDPERTRRAEKVYRDFLVVSALEGSSFPMLNRDADEIWHAHILDMRKYEADCRTICGSVLYHEVLAPEAEAAIDVKEAMQRWLAVTGEPIVEPDLVCVMRRRRPPRLD